MMNESITSPLLDSIAALRTGIASSQDRICRGLVRRTAALPPLTPPAPWADHASLFSTILDYLDAELLALQREINDADMHLYVAEEFLLDLQRSDKGGTDEPSDQDLEDAKTRLLGARHRMNEDVRPWRLGRVVGHVCAGWAQRFGRGRDVRRPPPFSSRSRSPRARSVTRFSSSSPCRAVADMKTAIPDLWQIVRLGLEHVPTILELVDDGTDTGMTVCLFGGTYAVGDVAVAAFMSLVDDVPVALMAADGDQGAVDGMGFGIYWGFVRESGEHRHSMRRSLEEWFYANRSRLEWVRLPASPASGHYRVAGDGPSEQ